MNNRRWLKAIGITTYLIITLYFALTLISCTSTRAETWTEDTCNQPEMKCYGKCGERLEDIECICEYKREKGCL